RYKEGQLHGKQEYYFSNGIPKSMMHYLEGELHGEVALYHPSGKVKRTILFDKGRLLDESMSS
ncbi:MAG: hypothetical protein KBC64_08135, partial [Simkaniaceae bacterium]|nr:hypothetical protein [Simkaniaceae bacterium]